MSTTPMIPLPAPPTLLDGADMRVQESIHGHRFLQEQEPFMVVLEALAVCAAKPLGSVPPSDATHEAFHYDLPHRRKLRFLLFQDRHLEMIAQDDTIHDDAKWSVWKERVNNQFDPDNDGQDHFAYLDPVFDRRIASLIQAVQLLQSMELDVMHNRRWTSRFLAVTGPDMICPDLRESSNRNWAPDRRFFGRGGELVYLMLNRSRHVQPLGRLIGNRLLNPDDPMNRIASALSDPNETKGSSVHVGYLPYRRHDAYDRLAEDWLGILELKRLPNGHLFEPLFRITGLNLVVYLAERAREEVGAQGTEPIVADLTDGADSQLRQSAKAHLNRHRQAANRAVRAFIERRLEADEGWKTARELGSPTAAAGALRQLFGFKNRDLRRGAPDKQRDSFIEHALARDKNNIHKYLLPLAKDIGLAAARQRVGTWFAIDDHLLFALVMANVNRTLELRDFVSRLHERYGIVIGPVEARKAFDRLPVGAQSFEGNLMALEARMTRLALTQRLSDDCAFVMNPYKQESQ